MNRNKRRPKNEIRCGSMFKLVLLAAYVGMAALFYVGLKHGFHAKGTEKKELERELDTLRTSSAVATSQIAQLTSRVALQRELENGSIRLVPIPDTAIVRVNPSATPQTEPTDELLPVVHQVARQ